MSIPEKVVIQAVPWNVRVTDDELVDVDLGEGLYGVYRPDDQEIVIYRGKRSLEAQWKTLMHEVLHAMADEYHIRCLKAEKYHDDLDLIANAMVEFLIANGLIRVRRRKRAVAEGSTSPEQAALLRRRD